MEDAVVAVEEKGPVRDEDLRPSNKKMVET